jgi:hypothetical protein
MPTTAAYNKGMPEGKLGLLGYAPLITAFSVHRRVHRLWDYAAAQSSKHATHWAVLGAIAAVVFPAIMAVAAAASGNRLQSP